MSIFFQLSVIQFYTYLNGYNGSLISISILKECSIKRKEQELFYHLQRMCQTNIANARENFFAFLFLQVF